MPKRASITSLWATGSYYRLAGSECSMLLVGYPCQMEPKAKAIALRRCHSHYSRLATSSQAARKHD